MTQPVFVTAVVESFTYTGSNGSDIVGVLNDYSQSPVVWSILSETGGVLMVRRAAGFNDDYTINTDDVIVLKNRDELTFEKLTTEQFINKYAPFVDVLGSVAPPVQAIGVATVPSLAGNTQTTISVTLNPVMPSMDYTVAAAALGTVSILGSLSVLSTSKVSESQVDVVVRNTGLLTISAGGSVLVAAVAEV